MAHTVRRKNTEYNYYWVYRDYCWGRPFQHPLTSDRGRKNVALYHSDAGTGSIQNATAPRWYRKMLHRKCRMRENQEVFNWTLRPETVEVPKPKRVRDASWYW